jgi:hypothetical protein
MTKMCHVLSRLGKQATRFVHAHAVCMYTWCPQIHLVRYCAESDSAFIRACDDFVPKYQHSEAARGYDGPGIQFEPAAKGRARGERAAFVRKFKNFHSFDETILGRISKDPEMLAIVEKLIFGENTNTAKGADGADGAGIQPPSLDFFQSTALLKMPRVGREKPWHQDHAYFDVEISKSPSGAPSNIVGIWLALDPATTDNGCMHYLAGSNCTPIHHWQVRDWQICDRDCSAGECHSEGCEHGTPRRST